MFLKGAELLAFRLLYCSRCSVLVLWVQQVKEAVWKCTAWNSLTRMLADGLMLDLTSASLCTQDWRVTTLAWQVHLGILPHRCINLVLSQRGRAAQLSEGRESAHVSRSFSLQRKTALGVDRHRMGRTTHSSRHPSTPYGKPSWGKKKKKSKAYL